LDVAVYAEALAMRLGWRTLSLDQWMALAAEREAMGAHPDSMSSDGVPPAVQLGLFQSRPGNPASVRASPASSAVPTKPLPREYA
jgi:hypothetical protein